MNASNRCRWFVSVLAVCVLALVSVAAPGQLRSYVVLAWDFPDRPVSNTDTNWPFTLAPMLFNIYVQTNLTVPRTNWFLLKAVDGSNRTARIELAPGAYFFAVTASNWWGESVFSNVLGIDGVLPSDSRVELRFGGLE